MDPTAQNVNLIQPYPNVMYSDYQQNLIVSYLAHVPPLLRVLWNQLRNICVMLLTNKQINEVKT